MRDSTYVNRERATANCFQMLDGDPLGSMILSSIMTLLYVKSSLRSLGSKSLGPQTLSVKAHQDSTRLPREQPTPPILSMPFTPRYSNPSAVAKIALPSLPVIQHLANSLCRALYRKEVVAILRRAS